MKGHRNEVMGKGGTLLLTVVGARPQFIKSAALTRVLMEGEWRQWLVHAGQHADDDMGSNFLSELNVPMPDVRIRPSQVGRSHRLADMMLGILKEIQRTEPSAVLVFGDTDATLAGALAAHHAEVPLVHVESGLRSGDRDMPEEHNRVMTDQLSDLLCTTGEGASNQLRKEGVSDDRISEVGDVMLDLALMAKALVQDRFPPFWPKKSGQVLVVTMHRPSTADSPIKLKAALDAMEHWAKRTGGRVYFPVHPRTLQNLEQFKLNLPESIINPGPLGYLDMQAALHHADCVLTDSGGVQKEAWFQGTSAVIMRSTTEWVELLDLGASELFDPNQLSEPGGALALAECLVQKRTVPPVLGSGLFGEGQASRRIVEALTRFLER